MVLLEMGWQIIYIYICANDNDMLINENDDAISIKCHQRPHMYAHELTKKISNDQLLATFTHMAYQFAVILSP